MKTVAIFVDVQNIYYTTRQSYQRHFDYHAFWSIVTKNRRVITAQAYAIDKGDSKQQNFQKILRQIGFEVNLKPYLQRSDGSAKGDWDVGITLDIVDIAPQTDIVVLLSGDGDFSDLLQRIRRRHAVDTEVYGVPNLTSATLIQSADRFIAIDENLLL